MWKAPNIIKRFNEKNYWNYCVAVTESYQLYVPELAPVGKAVGRIRANDEDEGQNAEVTYSITNAEAAAIFTITADADRREGIISLKQVWIVDHSTQANTLTLHNCHGSPIWPVRWCIIL